MSVNTQAQEVKKEDTKLYKAIWRWHFYAGLFVTPFMIILAVTGIMMMLIAFYDGRDAEKVTIPIPQNIILKSYQEQLNIVLKQNKDSVVIEMIKAPSKDKVNVFRLKTKDKKQILLAINPYTGEIVENWDRRQGLYDLADTIHGDLLLGKAGDRILEIASGFAIILLISGLYLWWPRNKSITSAFLPNFSSKGRGFWKELHISLGIYTWIFYLLFLLTGLTWTGIWGAKIVQSWSSFPQEKWNKVPLSDKTHTSLNYGASHNIPWGLEQTKLPISTLQKNEEGIKAGEVINIDSIVKLANEMGFEKRYRISFPKTQTGVWTINQDTMSGDATNPFGDKTYHIDQYSGKLLAKVEFDDYSFLAKTMAVSVPLHMGLVSIWNLIINLFLCLAIIAISISGVILWWKRRPQNSGFKLVAPRAPKELPHYEKAMLMILFCSVLFPLTGLTLITVLLIDLLIISKIPPLKKFFN